MNILFNLHDVYQSYFTSAIKKAKDNVTGDAVTCTEQAKRKTVTAVDVVYIKNKQNKKDKTFTIQLICRQLVLFNIKIAHLFTFCRL